MSLWEHFDHLELNPLKDTVGRTPPLHAHLLHPDFRTGPRTQPEAHTDETPPPGDPRGVLWTHWASQATLQ